MYQPVAKSPDFPTLERRILALWEEVGAFPKLRAQNQGKPVWSFLDGPITANNPMGVHHAWGRTLKDMYQRYHAMCGHELRYQNGFDCQGLWVEVEVEKEHGFKSKRDIEGYGLARFVEDCKARVMKYSRIQTEQSIRLGYWMDWDDSYYTMSDTNNYAIWGFLKRCHQRGYLYRGFDSMPWCPRCGVGLSQMEMHEGYKWVEHLSVVVRLPIRDRANEALLVWTTTPWTLTSNVAAAVHPDMRYLRVKQGEWTYYVGADNWEGKRHVEVEEESASGKKRRVVKLETLPQLVKRHGDVEVVGEVVGRELLGLRYAGPFDELPAQRQPGGYPHASEELRGETGVSGHRVIAWDAVTGSEGTGIVHIAPGCGREDHLLGKELGLVAISPIDESGTFLPAFGWLAGRAAHDVATDIADDLRKKGALIANERYPHRYAHCWRCGTAILYRLVDEWFVSMAWRDRIMGTVSRIRWIPDYGEQRELDWLRNMGDWMISKKRYWGLALPIWRCEQAEGGGCDWFDVVGSREELRARAVEGWQEFDGHTPHRPWVDAVKIRCERCGGLAARIPDVGNPWLDAGIVPYSTMGHGTPRFDKWFPADLVLESLPGQFRNWFYALLATNAMMQEDRWETGELSPPFKTLVGHALVRDEEGKEMHKSLGNAIEFNAAAETIGAEVMRYIYAGQNPTSNLNFPDIRPDRRTDVLHLDQEVNRKLLTLWNCYSFYVTYARVDGITPAMLTVPPAARSDLDRWILSKLQGLIQSAHELLGGYRAHLVPGRFEQFLDDLSNWYLRRSRRRFWKSESDADKLAAYATLYEALEGVCRLMAPILPFLCEEIYQNLVRSVTPDAPVSVHLCPYPVADESLVDAALEARIDTIVRYKNLGLSIRSAAAIKTRQPLARLIVKPETELERAALVIEPLVDQLRQELNVKAVELVDTTAGLLEVAVKPNFKSIGQRYGPRMKAIQAHLKAADPAAIQQALADDGSYTFDVEGARVELGAEDVVVSHTARGDIAFQVDRGAFCALDVTLTPDLVREGIARDFVRGVQSYRKERDLAVTDRIALGYHADGDVAAAIAQFSDYIRKETLALEMSADASLDGAGREVLTGGGGARIELRVVAAP